MGALCAHFTDLKLSIFNVGVTNCITIFYFDVSTINVN